MQGCPYIIAVIPDSNLVPKHNELCLRIPEDASSFCPKHALMMREQAAENARKMERARKGKEKKQTLAAMLVESPLRVP